MAGPGQPEEGSIQIDSKSYFIARDRLGRILHETVSTGKQLKEEWDFRNGSWGMGETVRQTDTGYFFTENMDCTKRGLRLSPSITSATLQAQVPAWPRPPVFWEAQHPTDGTRFLYAAYFAAAAQFVVTKLRIADLINLATPYTTSGASASYPSRPVRFNGAWVLPVDLIGTTDVDAWLVFLDANLGDDHSAFSPAVTLAEDVDVSETSIDVNDASGISVNDILAVERERMLVTNIATNTLTVTRAYLDTTAETHANTTSVQEATTASNFAADSVTSNDTATSVQCAFLLDQTSGTPTIARVITDASVQKYATTTTGATLVTNLTTNANFTNVGDVGDRSTKALGAASHAGITIIGKQDNAYAFDKDGNSYPVIPTLNRFVDTVNPNAGTGSVGSGTLSYGTDVFYPHPTGLWLIENVSRATNISVDKIPYYASVPNITAPIRLRYFEGWALGDWIYWIYTDKEQGSSTSYLLAMKFERHPAHGLGVSWHTILKRSTQMRGAFITDDAKFFWAEHGTASTPSYIQLAKDGSPDSTNRGAASGTFEWYGPEVDFGEPEITKQLRYAFVEMENGQATCSWQFKQYRDSSTVESIGSALTTASGNVNWTVGTTDTCRRLRPRLTATTSGHDVTTDPKVIHLIIYARSADVVRVVLTPKDRRSHKSMFETAKVLRKLKDAGPITIREPETNETFSGYIRSVGDVYYDGPKGPERGLEIVYERFTAAA